MNQCRCPNASLGAAMDQGSCVRKHGLQGSSEYQRIERRNRTNEIVMRAFFVYLRHLTHTPGYLVREAFCKGKRADRMSLYAWAVTVSFHYAYSKHLFRRDRAFIKITRLMLPLKNSPSCRSSPHRYGLELGSLRCNSVMGQPVLSARLSR